MSGILTLEEAAEALGMTPEELTLCRARGLAPGTLGFKESLTGPLVWKSEDLSPSAEKLEAMAEMVETIAENTNQCYFCGFQAKSKGGLTRHINRQHE